ncbi:GH25 family lysozyme [Actinophytocola algeriensis]|uniref:GH25 family lysozyme M1 (1,4-beta-N-acetylmuramidase) n=1 Tax=Actinophytocola algeriensis TaxID=1768010 RepID=A0A7W7Q4L8_9PSEU|nr:GH25 family lysozyme [Actinophytocola algeriensis]MBB4906981.1 GH25 family lysozyme M1 (1,4-beta-N-acetylmuramidase) [Actinophytocola algeriensis]MBE1478464.1 GH25 family lysozyme M1 (1,4-beta-N-acetylmuramidase) [Actinophytocola algeriensis]
MGRWLGAVLSVTVASAASAGLLAVAPAASADEADYPVVGGVVRDNVDNTHGRSAAEEFDGRPQARIAADYVRGIDVSRWQHDTPIDWSQVAGSGVRFVGVKATEGNYDQQEFYASDMSGAQGAGMYSFPYHFATPNDSGATEQANYFLDYANFTPNGKTLRPAIDIETNPYDTANRCYDKTPAQLVSWVREFVDVVKRRTGVDPIVYTAPAFWQECMGNSSAFASYPLWVASWSSNPTTPTLPAGWSNWELWQYSATTTVPGITGPVDGNYVRGGEEALAALATKASDPSGYTAIAPTRVLDTRGSGPLGARGSVTVDLSSRLPATATAAVLNVTGIATANTFVTVWPTGATRPNASNLNLVAGDIRPNLVTVQLNADRKVQVYNNSGSTHVLADLAGWYATDAPGLNTALAPQRVLDTRSTAAVGPGGKVTLNLSSRVPASATAVTLNLTGVGATLSTFVTAWPTGVARPNASNLNLASASPTSNLVTVQLGTNRSVDLYNNSGQVHLLADLAGYYGPDSGAKFIALSPMRVLDTRTATTNWTPVSGGGTAVPLTMSGPIPAGATAAVMNLTGVSPSVATFVSAYPKTSATPARPTTSNLNLTAGQILPNLSSVALGPNRDVWLFNNAGTINLIADLAGYFAPDAE